MHLTVLVCNPFCIFLQVNALIKELAAAAAAAKGLTFDAGVEARLCAYARSVSHFPTALKEVSVYWETFNRSGLYIVYHDVTLACFVMALQFEWRNGWFYNLSQKALASGASDPCPLHTAWLKELGAV